MNEPMNQKKLLQAFSYTLSATVTVVFFTLITIVADVFLPLKDWLKLTFTHHWIGKGVLGFVLFFVSAMFISLLPLRLIDQSLEKALRILFWTSLLGTLAIFSFFTFEFLSRLA
ncbi:MAG: hypothetical protein AAB545_02750 [Patescibacteria group bacterium]